MDSPANFDERTELNALYTIHQSLDDQVLALRGHMARVHAEIARRESASVSNNGTPGDPRLTQSMKFGKSK